MTLFAAGAIRTQVKVAGFETREVPACLDHIEAHAAAVTATHQGLRQEKLPCSVCPLLRGASREKSHRVPFVACHFSFVAAHGRAFRHSLPWMFALQTTAHAYIEIACCVVAAEVADSRIEPRGAQIAVKVLAFDHNAGSKKPRHWSILKAHSVTFFAAEPGLWLVLPTVTLFSLLPQLCVFLLQLLVLLPHLLNQVEEAERATVTRDSSSFCQSLARGTHQIYHVAFARPVVLELIDRGEFVGLFRAVQFAFYRNAAHPPMTLPLFVRKQLCTLFARELAIVERLKHKAVQFFAKVELFAAIRTGVVSLSPLLDAGLTAQLVAVLALGRIFDNHEADCARKV